MENFIFGAVGYTGTQFGFTSKSANDSLERVEKYPYSSLPLPPTHEYLFITFIWIYASDMPVQLFIRSACNCQTVI